MTVDVYQIPSYFPTNDPANPGTTYTKLTTVGFIPVLNSYFCDLVNDKAYRVLQVLSSKDLDRAIVVTVPQTISVKNIFFIPGEHPTSTVDIFSDISGEVPSPPGSGGYGLINSPDFIPPIGSFYYQTLRERTYRIIDVLYAIGEDRTIVLAVPSAQDALDIFNLP
jgi:hypothetical protein